MQKLFNQCPACGSPLVITECKCPACQLQMRGEFQPGQLSDLSDETLTLVKVFLTAGQPDRNGKGARYFLSHHPEQTGRD